MRTLWLLCLLLVWGPVTLAQGTLILRDEFVQDEGYWPLDSTHSRQAWLAAGQLHLLQPPLLGPWLFTTEQYVETRADMAFGTVLTQQDAGLQATYGLVWSADAAGRRYYAFLIRPEGYFAVVEGQQGEEQYLIDWTRHRRIKGPGKAHTLVVRKEGWQLQFEINGKQVAKLAFPRLQGLFHGLYLRGPAHLTAGYFYIEHPPVPIRLIDGPELLASKRLLDSTVSQVGTHEVAPQLMPRGDELYFSRADTAAGLAALDIWWSTVQGDSMWGPAQKLPVPLNHAGPNTVVQARDRTLLLGSWYGPDGGDGGPGLALSARTATGWSAPANQARPALETHGPVTDWWLSPDGKTLVFAANLPGGYGDLDLYMSQQQADGRWSPPRNLGPTLNTFGDERSPYLSAAGDSLYFASEGHPGYGRGDVYLSRRLSNSWTQWSPPVNLGPRINGPTWDGWYTPLPGRPRHVYMASVDSLRGDYDLYGVRIPIDRRRQPLVRVYGQVRDRRSGRPLSASVQALDLGKDAIRRDTRAGEDGGYSFFLPYQRAYQLYTERIGYYPVVDTLDVRPVRSYREIRRDLYLQPIGLGDTIQLKRLYFQRATAELLPESYPELDRLVALMRGLPTLEIEIRGHTDNIGGVAELQALSEARAARVEQYLIEHGIAPDRLRSLGFGGSLPIADNTNPATRPQNRRVECIIRKR
ncbi:MAG: hypothetical protein D6722_02590 [Bacteroidetes bacterium]|nr:MAG: hypothetical protein D6722_02590 [Bacteroidota bacterium]